MAIACLRLVTFLPDLPLCRVPSCISCMAFSTFLAAFLPYFAMAHSSEFACAKTHANSVPPGAALFLGVGLGCRLGRGLGSCRFGLGLVAVEEAPDDEDRDDEDAQPLAAERAGRQPVDLADERSGFRVGERGHALLRGLRRDTERLQLRGDLAARDGRLQACARRTGLRAG